MAGFLTDSDDDMAVDEVLSQVMDMTVLEQVAAINCAGFNDSGLPTNLETRFQKLKSFPSSTTKKPTSLSTKSFSLPHSPHFKKCDSVNETKRSDPSEDGEKKIEQSENGVSKCSKKSPEEKSWESCLSPAKSSDTWISSPFKKTPRGKLGKKETESPSSFGEGFSSRSVSPPAKNGCFLCSPKKVLTRKKSKENRGFGLGLDWGKNDELLSELSNFSSRSQKKLMKKAMEEEEKICREADKIVKWAKHASARMEVSDIEDELSDTENYK